MAQHETVIVMGGNSHKYPWQGCVDVFCSCGEFWINVTVPRVAMELAESHKWVMNGKEAE